MIRGSVLGFLCSALVWLAPSRAHAFEREWHVGGGVGLTAYPNHYGAGPSLGLNAGYGISDVFDLKLELLGSSHTYQATAESPRERGQAYSAAAGLSYKLDILQWIPYGAALVGFQHIAGPLPISDPFRRNDALVAVVLGLDYAATRNFGLGVSFRTNILLSTIGEGEAFTTMLRAEYHWGF
ncbi:MAG TPA: outer membrane beta-barrel protein [Polyangiaceae bacterium]|nr:outer membrane beta-barrel protein [Polyangiaceae bacterium]